MSFSCLCLSQDLLLSVSLGCDASSSGTVHPWSGVAPLCLIHYSMHWCTHTSLSRAKGRGVDASVWHPVSWQGGCSGLQEVRERESTLLLPSLPVPVFHLALLLVFLQSLVLPVNRGFWRSPTLSPGPGEQPHDRADLLLQPKPLSAKRQPEPLLPGAMRRERYLCESAGGEIGGHPAPTGRTFPIARSSGE